jgi:4-amino-4-deoxy-L-arabinose transferase-like glycosyltransferase
MPSRGSAPEILTAGQRLLLAAGALALLAVMTLSLGNVGLLGPDEPRYAFIGRHMAESGDWLTPRLWTEPPAPPGLEPWFEKPPLLYWMIAAGFRAGLSPDWAPRLPVALLSWGFVVFFWWSLRRLEGTAAATVGTMVLATSVGWMAFSVTAATDLPLAATFNSALVLLLLRLRGGPPWMAAAAGACFGLALLAKGLVAGVLVLPLLWWMRRDVRGLLTAAAAALAVALPWFALMSLRHGWAFIEVFFIKHHFARFASESLQHVQPFWFYVPVLLGGLFPWLPLLVGLMPRLWAAGPRRVFAATAVFGFIFFSASTNKLPGYLLPLWPSLAALIAVGVHEARETRRSLAVAALLLALAPVAGSALPEALLVGARRTQWGGLPWEYVAAAIPLAALAWWLQSRARHTAAAAVVASGTLIGVIYIQLSAYPVLDQVVSARGLARRVAPHSEVMCVERLHRALRYGLNYYLKQPLPACEQEPRPVVLDQNPGGLPFMRRAGAE